MINPKKSGKLKNPKTDWQERVVAIQRVTKVVKGGKKMSFRAVVVVGNEQGKVGVGVGKASDVITAVKKGVTDGKKTRYYGPFNRSKFNTSCYNWSFWCSKVSFTSICPWLWGNCGWVNTNCS
jgi:small subunit ribosomal protein S5